MVDTLTRLIVDFPPCCRIPTNAVYPYHYFGFDLGVPWQGVMRVVGMVGFWR